MSRALAAGPVVPCGWSGWKGLFSLAQGTRSPQLSAETPSQRSGTVALGTGPPEQLHVRSRQRLFAA